MQPLRQRLHKQKSYAFGTGFGLQQNLELVLFRFFVLERLLQCL
jgi:hypothetical protein